MQVTNLQTFLDKNKGGTGARKLQGVAEAKLLMVQSTDSRGEPSVSLVLDTGKKRYSFPERTWDSLGVPHDWLDGQIDEYRHPVKAFLRRYILRVLRVID
jgi:hypothetical protein